MQGQRSLQPPSRGSEDHLRALYDTHRAVFGVNGHNGLYRSHKHLTDRMTGVEEGLSARITAIEDLINTTKLVASITYKVSRWAFLSIVFMAVTLAPDKLADLLIKALGAAKTASGLF